MNRARASRLYDHNLITTSAVCGCQTYTMTGALTSPGSSTTSASSSTSIPSAIPSAIPRPASPSDQSARGLIPRILAYLFTAGNSGEYSGLTLACSYAEVYNEEIRDLLVDSSTGQPAAAAVQRRQVKDAREAERLYAAGAMRRRKGETKQNSESSRSHAILTLHIGCQHNATHRAHTAELSLVDLAGSEKASAANNEQQQREGSRINLSLSHLTRVVEAIADGKEHIPYRDSKLTYLLKPCLEGNALTTLIANLSDHAPNLPDTINTLRFAGRCKKIKQRVLAAQQSAGTACGASLAGLDEALVQLIERQDGIDGRCRVELSGKVRRLLASFSRTTAVDAVPMKKRKVDGPTAGWADSGESGAVSGETSGEVVELRAELSAMDARLMRAQREMAECKVEADEQLAELMDVVERQRQQSEQAERDLAHVAALLDEVQQQKAEGKRTRARDSKRPIVDRAALPSGKENSGAAILSPGKRLLSPTEQSSQLPSCADLQSPLAVRNRAVSSEAKTPMSSIASVLEKRQAHDRERDRLDASNAVQQPASSIPASYRYSTMELDPAMLAAGQLDADDVMPLSSLLAPSLKLAPSGSRRASAPRAQSGATFAGQPFSIRTPLRTSLIR